MIRSDELLTAEEWPAAPRVQSTKECKGRQQADENTSNTSQSITGTWDAFSPYCKIHSLSNSFSERVLLFSFTKPNDFWAPTSATNLFFFFFFWKVLALVIDLTLMLELAIREGQQVTVISLRQYTSFAATVILEVVAMFVIFFLVQLKLQEKVTSC